MVRFFDLGGKAGGPPLVTAEGDSDLCWGLSAGLVRCRAWCPFEYSGLLRWAATFLAVRPAGRLMVAISPTTSEFLMFKDCIWLSTSTGIWFPFCAMALLKLS